MQDTTEDAVGGLKLTQKVTITMSNVASPDVKTALGEKDAEGKYPLYWSNGDQVSINGVASNKLELEAGVQSASVSFEVEGVSAPFKVSYPATENAGEVVFAAKQTHTEGTFSAGAAPMYGESETASIELKHLVGVLKFGFLAPADTEITIDRLLITSEDANLAGTFTAEVVGDEVVLTPTEAVSKSIVYDCGGIALSSEEPTYLYVTVPAGEYDKLRISLFSTDYTIMEFAVRAGDKPIKAGVVREFGAKTFQGNSAMYIIEDSESLMEFAKLCADNKFTFYTGVNLTQSFTFDDATYDWTPVAFFEGEFKGNGNTITGLTDALFNEASGYIHNLTLASNIVKDDAGLYHGIIANTFQGKMVDCTAKGSIEHTALTSTDEENTAVAGVIGRANGSLRLENVVNEALVTVTATDATISNIAGIVGIHTAGSFDLINCSNKGAITTNEDYTSKNTHIGGIFALTVGGTSATMSGCSNIANITSNHSQSAGELVVGGLYAANQTTLTTELYGEAYNTNSGDITIKGSISSSLAIGGCIGRIEKGNTIAKYFKNLQEAELLISAQNPVRMDYGGVVGHLNVAPSTVEDCHNYGSVVYAGTMNGASAGYYSPTVGGIVGRINQAGHTLRNIHNHGVVACNTAESSEFLRMKFGGVLGYCEGARLTMENCTNDAELTFSGKTSGVYYAGGIAGHVASEGCTITDLTNTGKLTYSGTAVGSLYIGGIIGELASCGTLNTITNGLSEQPVASKLTIGGTASHVRAGGCIGNLTTTADTALIESATNYAAIDWTGETTNTSTSRWSSIELGGVLGRLSGVAATADEALVAKDFTNRGKITIIGNTKSPYPCLGGVAGYISAHSVDNFDNWGAIESNITMSGATISGNNTEINLGGVVGYFQTGSFKNCDNHGNVDAKYALSGVHQHIGGVAGYIATYSLVNDGNQNHGNITTHETHQTKRMRFGGLYGVAYRSDISNSGNNGTVTFGSGGKTSNQLHVGGITGYQYTGSSDLCNYTDSFHTGAIVVNADTGAKAAKRIGGLVGDHNENSGGTYQGCYNTGSITLASVVGSGDDLAKGYSEALYVGGIVAVPRATNIINEARFEGSITAPAAHQRQVGCIVGTAAGTGLVKNSKIDGSITKAGEYTEDINVDNFYKFVYSTTPDSWAEAEVPYDGNYGVVSAGGDSNDDL